MGPLHAGVGARERVGGARRGPAHAAAELAGGGPVAEGAVVAGDAVEIGPVAGVLCGVTDLAGIGRIGGPVLVAGPADQAAIGDVARDVQGPAGLTDQELARILEDQRGLVRDLDGDGVGAVAQIAAVQGELAHRGGPGRAIHLPGDGHGVRAGQGVGDREHRLMCSR